MMNSSTDQTRSDAMLTDPSEGGGASITGSKAPLRAREDGSPAKPEAQRTKVRAQRCSFPTSRTTSHALATEAAAPVSCPAAARGALREECVLGV